MTDILALENLFTRVRAAMQIEGVPVTNLFGWRVSAKQVEGGRIAWQPGDPTGSAGELGPVRNPGGQPVRSLYTFHELFTVTISASDRSAPEDEVAQTRATRFLYDAWVRAVHRVAYGAWAQRSIAWVAGDRITERRHGTALRIVASIDAYIPDQPWDNTTPPTQAIPAGEANAVLEIKALDRTDVIPVNLPEGEDLVTVESGDLLVTDGGDPIVEDDDL